MFKKDYYKKIRIVSGFGVDRGSYKHSGVDYPGTKKDEIINLINGKVHKIIYAKEYFGTQCIMYSNPKYAGGVDDALYHSYCHLFKVDVKEGEFVEAGKELGLMGNSGGSYTAYDENGKYTGKYRLITEEEKNDDACNFGVHLHLWYYQQCKAGGTTKLLKDLQKKKIVSKSSLGDTHFYQWNKLIIAPRVIYTYFKQIQK